MTNVDDSGLLQEDLKSKLNHLDIYDRVVNLKLTMSNGDEFVIRSDYEVYYPDLIDNIYSNVVVSKRLGYVRKCQHKPDIKVQFKKHTFTVATEIDIFVSNFSLLDKDGTILKAFNAQDVNIAKIDVEMGYFGQFEKSINPLGDVLKTPIPIATLFDFNKTKLNALGITVLSVNTVTYVQTDKLPPDMKVHIHGYVGSLSSTGVTVESVANNYIMKKSDITKSIEFSVGGKSIFEQVLHENITKCFVNPSKITNKFLTLGLPFADTTQGSTALLTPMNDAQALMYGVKVGLSPSLLLWAREYDTQNTIVDSNGTPQTNSIVTVGFSDTVIGKLNMIKSNFGLSEIQVVESNDGALLLYTKDDLENIEILDKSMSSVTEDNLGKLYWGGKLPAVYNITNSAVCVVQCPFFFVLNPFESFEFKTAYSLSGLVSFFGKFTNAEQEKFFALWQNITFATVSDENLCEIACIGEKKK